MGGVEKVELSGGDLQCVSGFVVERFMLLMVVPTEVADAEWFLRGYFWRA